MNRAVGLLLALAVLANSRPAFLMGQTSQTAALTIQVSVASGLTVLRDRDLNFGQVAANTGLNAVTLASANVGKLHIYGGQNRAVNVTLTPPAQLRNGGSVIPYTWQASYNEQLDDPAAGTTQSFAAPTATFRLRNTSPTGNYGQAFLWLYGSIVVGGVPPGLYTGTMTVSAAY